MEQMLQGLLFAVRKTRQEMKAGHEKMARLDAMAACLEVKEACLGVTKAWLDVETNKERLGTKSEEYT
jgi:hypothetical protein